MKMTKMTRALLPTLEIRKAQMTKMTFSGMTPVDQSTLIDQQDSKFSS